ncbi:MAG: hypothetical protein IT365_23410 [Candidatus Hydrogenedentes bacterium]|nr:hypothetical protein [Candidatus Hydrogenedentota bacterium]
MRLYPVEWKRECWATCEALISFGLLSAAFYILIAWLRPETHLLRIRIYAFGIIALYGFSCGTALSAFRYGKGLGRNFGAIMLLIHFFLVCSFLDAHHHW